MHCYHCNSSFNFEFAHAGFGDEIFFYCDQCGIVATVDTYSEEMSKGRFYEKYILGRKYNTHRKQDLAIFEENIKKMKIAISKGLQPCSCGGKFTIDAIPRCPVCNKELEWDKVVDEIDSNSDSVTPRYFKKILKKGWHDIYYFVFNGRQIRNNWKK